MQVCRGIRGAINIKENTREAILSATRELLATIVERNGVNPDDIASAILTTTSDLTAEYPAIAARQLGWMHVPLLCAHEMDVPHGLRLCIRVLILWNTAKSPQEIQHVYLRDAVNLRPDLVMAQYPNHR